MQNFILMGKLFSRFKLIVLKAQVKITTRQIKILVTHYYLNL